MKQLVVCIMVFLMWSCAPSKIKPQIEKETITKIKIIEVPRDTIINVPADSSLYKALIECQDGKPVIVDTVREIIKGNYVQPPKISIDSNVISVVSKAEAQRLFFEWKEQYIKEITTTTKTSTVTEEIEKPLNWWQILWLNLGRIVGLGVIVYVLVKFVPWRNLVGLLVR